MTIIVFDFEMIIKLIALGAFNRNFIIKKIKMLIFKILGII